MEIKYPNAPQFRDQLTLFLKEVQDTTKSIKIYTKKYRSEPGVISTQNSPEEEGRQDRGKHRYDLGDKEAGKITGRNRVYLWNCR